MSCELCADRLINGRASGDPVHCRTCHATWGGNEAQHCVVCHKTFTGIGAAAVSSSTGIGRNSTGVSTP